MWNISNLYKISSFFISFLQLLFVSWHSFIFDHSLFLNKNYFMFAHQSIVEFKKKNYIQSLLEKKICFKFYFMLKRFMLKLKDVWFWAPVIILPRSNNLTRFNTFWALWSWTFIIACRVSFIKKCFIWNHMHVLCSTIDVSVFCDRSLCSCNVERRLKL